MKYIQNLVIFIYKHVRSISQKSDREGFTLLEILLVVAALGILAGIVILAINPAKQLADTRNAQRRVDINTILNGVYQYTIDNNGFFPPTIPGPPVDACTTASAEICTTSGGCPGGLVDLSVITESGIYLTAIPTDPQLVTVDGTGYRLATTSSGRLTVCAPGTEQVATPFSVTR